MSTALLAILIIIIDQWSKYYISTHMWPGLSIPIVENIFHITYILNPGAAFGILKYKTGFFILITIMLLVAAIYYYPRLPARAVLGRIGLGLLVGGAIGNLIDRIRLGVVIDFFDFRIWPIFNVADMAIVSGVALIVYTLLYLTPKEGT